MIASSNLLILFLVLNSVAGIHIQSIVNSPTSNILVNSEKAIMLQQIGTYASQLKEEIVYSIIPIKNACIESSSTNICAFATNEIYPNVVEVATTLPPRDTVSVLPRYDNKRVSNSIRNNVRKMLRIKRSIEFVEKQDSTVHLIDDQFYTTNDMQQSIKHSANVNLKTDKSDIVELLPTSSSIILKQIANNKIGFDFLTDNELKLFLSTVMSMIDKSYQITDLTESLRLFTELIMGQSIYILRSCVNGEKHSSASQLCIIIATLFLRPLITNNNTLSAYRLTPLPAMIGNEQFIYSNIPSIVVISTEDQSVMPLDTASNKNKCLFSIFTYCPEKMPFIQLKNIPCLSELLNDDKQLVTSCEVTRARKIQTGLINIETDIWLISVDSGPMHCQLQSNSGQYNGFIVINEPSIIHLPCHNAMICSDIKLTSSICTDRNVLIKSSPTAEYEQLLNIPWSLQAMNKQLLSTYQLTVKNSIKTILNDLKDNRLTLKTIIEEVGAIALCAIFICLALFIVYFVYWLKRMMENRIEPIENNVDDLVYIQASHIKTEIC
ncbi:unnamed protein product [Adineta steineri]|uniref:Envelope fusion protein n=1 Tax=Adineta steineri TaxID=433720 RepID=A0A814WSW2_9BILA|nr:unnamed protein product [Adineta steineri]CAF1452439.1 unnamed protein product [Adineta steineri]CAF1456096.1 unnamed protein product [Adineta steineri]CAF1480598.1 unnamed protein product [Adineta steineri]CAF1497010.1 unnamed protein product [Adineta steineri]